MYHPTDTPLPRYTKLFFSLPHAPESRVAHHSSSPSTPPPIPPSPAPPLPPPQHSTMGSIRRSKTKRRTRDLDQVHGDLRNPRQLAQLKALIPDEDRPGGGVHHCVECAKYFEQEHNLLEHRREKIISGGTCTETRG